MSESREQFRQLLSEKHSLTYDVSLTDRIDKITAVSIPGIGESLPADQRWAAEEDAMADAAEAVYAQALRDVIDLVARSVAGTAASDITNLIERHAAERGIDLDATP